MNLSLAQGLPQTQPIDISALYRKLDDWTSVVDHGVRRALARRKRGEAIDLTGDQYRVMAMITILQRNLGVTYNLKFSQGEYDATDSRNLFIHGLLTGFGGTCVTMPVLYCAIGRRLGWPLKVVFAKEHVFCRWDEGPTSTFNIEPTCQGLKCHSDEHYLHWPKPIEPQEIERGWCLRSLTPREELAFFVANRGNCFLDHLQPMFAADDYLQAHQLAPNHPAYYHCWQLSLVVLQITQQVRKAPAPARFRLPAPRDQAERKYYQQGVKTFNRILANRRAKRMPPDDLMFTITT